MAVMVNIGIDKKGRCFRLAKSNSFWDRISPGKRKTPIILTPEESKLVDPNATYKKIGVTVRNGIVAPILIDLDYWKNRSKYD